MYLLLETIRYSQGKFDNLEWHNLRMNRSLGELYSSKTKIDLMGALKASPKPCEVSTCIEAVYKCRIVYGVAIDTIEFIPYQLPNIKSLHLIYDNNINYSLKSLNRSALNNLFNQRSGSDDVIIVKNGLITDTTFANILFFADNKWLTPVTPLLPGTRRQALLQAGIIKTASIYPYDLNNFEKLRLVNAMIRFEDEVDISLEYVSG